MVCHCSLCPYNSRVLPFALTNGCLLYVTPNIHLQRDMPCVGNAEQSCQGLVGKADAVQEEHEMA